MFTAGSRDCEELPTRAYGQKWRQLLVLAVKIRYMNIISRKHTYVMCSIASITKQTGHGTELPSFDSVQTETI